VMANDRGDFIAAFIIGAVVGVGATLLLKPPTRKRRREYPIKRLRRRLRRRR
jgi:gas vesicle protein